jgi:hypothetical protein
VVKVTVEPDFQAYKNESKIQKNWVMTAAAKSVERKAGGFKLRT